MMQSGQNLDCLISAYLYISGEKKTMLVVVFNNKWTADIGQW